MHSKAVAFPKTYSVSIGWKIFLLIIGFPLGVGGVAGMWYFGSGHEVTNNMQMYALVTESLFISILGFWIAISSLLSRILVLQDEEILVVPGLFKDTIIDRQQISGYRIFASQGINVLQLYITGKNGSTKKTNVAMLFTPDELFTNWFSAISNIDAAKYAASIREIQTDKRLGDTPEERTGNMKKAQKISHVLNVVTFTFAGWAIFYPRPYILLFLVLTSLPVLVLWLCWRYQGSFSTDDTGKNTAQANLFRVLVMPGFILAIRALADVQMLDVTQLVVPTIVSLIALVFGIAWVEPTIYKRSIGKLVLVTVVMSVYPASVITIANAVFDQSPPERHIVPVLGKRCTTGKGASQYVKIAPWNSTVTIDEIKVTRELYQYTAIGQVICISIHSGALGFGWYSAGPASICRR